jgi:uncharacterized membrane protein
MTEILSSLFDTYDEARQTVRNLEAAEIPHDDISIVANHVGNKTATAGAEVGAVVGGGAGLLAGLGVLAIPGIGPVIGAGWLVATVVGAAAGAASGGIVGALVDAGLSKEDAHVYAEGVRRGGALVVVRVADSQMKTARMILQRHRSVDVVTRRRAYEEEGWRQFDPEAIPYIPPQIAGEPDKVPRK